MASVMYWQYIQCRDYRQGLCTATRYALFPPRRERPGFSRKTWVIFHAATRLDESSIATVQGNVRKHILRAFVTRGHIVAYDAKVMAGRAASNSHRGGGWEGEGVQGTGESVKALPDWDLANQ